MTDPFSRSDPTGIDDWLRSKGHDIKRPADPDNEWNRPLRRCRLPSCGAIIEGMLPIARYCTRQHKLDHYAELEAKSAEDNTETKECE